MEEIKSFKSSANHIRERGAKDILSILGRILPRETGFLKSYDLKLLCLLTDWRYSCSPNKKVYTGNAESNAPYLFFMETTMVKNQRTQYHYLIEYRLSYKKTNTFQNSDHH